MCECLWKCCDCYRSASARSLVWVSQNNINNNHKMCQRLWTCANVCENVQMFMKMCECLWKCCERLWTCANVCENAVNDCENVRMFVKMLWLLPISKRPLSCLSLTELVPLPSQPRLKLLSVFLLFRMELTTPHHCIGSNALDSTNNKSDLLLFEIFLILEELLLKVTCCLDIFCLDPLNEGEVVAPDLVQLLLQGSLPCLAWWGGGPIMLKR